MLTNIILKRVLVVSALVSFFGVGAALWSGDSVLIKSTWTDRPTLFCKLLEL
jgi:hypothetical protein